MVFEVVPSAGSDDLLVYLAGLEGWALEPRASVLLDFYLRFAGSHVWTG